jgi:cysteinyl-tRNA synthetase
MGLIKPISFYNTLTRSKDVFKPIVPGRVKLYACGPTVYNYFHIGNIRTYVFEDVLHRALEKAGYAVTHVMNITDVGHLQSDADEGDDKMALASAREQKSPWDIAKFYEAAYFKHAGMVNVQRPDVVCRATEHIPEMIEMVKTLLEKGYAYESGGNVYFDITKFDRYTEFARLRLDDQTATDRVEADERKRNQADFALWFSVSKYPNQIMQWDSPWGRGFPGWHIECSAMAIKYLGEHIDIHCGGIDHINVHHTNEIAQSECCLDHKWVNVWMHGEFLNIDGAKMSKSLNNFITVDTLVENGFDPLDYRYLLFTTHYRSSLKFSFDTMTSAHNTLQGLKQRVQGWLGEGHQPAAQLSATAQAYADRFWAHVFDDLHMPMALTVMWEALKDDGLNAADKLALLQDFEDVLALDLFKADERSLSAEQEALIAAREAARKAKNWAESDRLRDELQKLGVLVEDTPQGTKWKFV